MTTYSLEQLDRTIFEHLRLEVVRAGYLPDITQYTTGTAWQAARNTLRGTVGGQLIDVFGVGSGDERDELTGAKIIVNRTDERNGDIGAGGTIMTPIVDGFTKSTLPQTCSSITYEIVINADSVKYERLMSNIVSRAFGKMKHISVVNSNGSLSSTDRLFIRLVQKFDQSNLNFLQKLCTFIVDDIFLSTDVTVNDVDIVPINSIEFVIYARSVSGKIPESLVTTEYQD